MSWKLAFELIGMILLLIAFCWAPVFAIRWSLFRNPGNRNPAVGLPSGGVEFSAKPRGLWIGAILAAFALVNIGVQFAHHHSTWSEFASNGVCLALAFSAIYELPGTIVVDPFGIEQRFWIKPDKMIRWNEIVEINTGDKIRVITIKSSDGVTIVFDKDLADRPRFLREIREHCGSNLPADFPIE